VQQREHFTDLRGAWEAFLDYLGKRQGADIQRTRRMEELEAASRYVESELFEQQPDEFDDETKWFQAFERREDVLAALEGFLRHRRENS